MNEQSEEFTAVDYDSQADITTTPGVLQDQMQSITNNQAKNASSGQPGVYMHQ